MLPFCFLMLLFGFNSDVKVISQMDIRNIEQINKFKFICVTWLQSFFTFRKRNKQWCSKEY